MPFRGACGAVLVLALAMGAGGAGAAKKPAGAAGLNAEIETLAQDVARLEGARAVKKLQRAYGYYVDRGLWGEAADLFADDGSIEIGADGVYVGKARIREYLKRLGGGQEGLAYGQLNEHLQLQPVVDVAADGLSAKARWRDMAMLGHWQKDAFWGDAIEENDYVFESGVWKIRRLHIYTNFVAPLEGGWARMKPAPADWRSETAKAFPADRPPTENYRPFPEVNLPPFHYRNPGTVRLEARRGAEASDPRVAKYRERVERLKDH